MGKGRPQKYNRISCQDKYKLRRLILKEKLSVKQAARTLCINYSTAKTIMFFFRKSPSLSFDSLQKMEGSSSPQSYASYKVTRKPKKIEIISRIKGDTSLNNEGQAHESTEEVKKVKLQECF